MTQPLPTPFDPAQVRQFALDVVQRDRFPYLTTIDGDQPLTGFYLDGLLANDLDVDNDTSTIGSWGGGMLGELNVSPDGSFTYLPNPNFFGFDSITYTVSDGRGGYASATATILVNSVNDDPTAVPDSLTVDEDLGRAKLTSSSTTPTSITAIPCPSFR